MKKLLISTCIIFLAIFAFFFSNIKGYYRFKQYCEAEGGLRVYEPLERNVGWLAEDKRSAIFTARISDVGFVRFKDNNFDYDLFPVGERDGTNLDYLIKPANKDVDVVYSFEEVNPVLNDSKGVSAFYYQIRDISKNKVMLIFKVFYFEVFDSNITLLGVTERYSCMNKPIAAYLRQWQIEVSNNFK